MGRQWSLHTSRLRTSLGNLRAEENDSSALIVSVWHTRPDRGKDWTCFGWSVGGWVQANVHLAAAYSANQSLGRFFVFAMVEFPLGCWVLAGTTPADRFRRTWVATAALAVVHFGLAASGWEGYGFPWNPLFHEVTVALLIHLADSLYLETAEQHAASLD